MKSFSIVWLIYFIIAGVLIVGEIRCIYKVVTCNWNPIGKAEIVYTIGALSGFGAIIGYFDIKDE